MVFNIKLDCDMSNVSELYRHKAALLSATKMYNDYASIKPTLPGTGPELFAEQWLSEAISGVDAKFEDMVIIYFGKILLGASHGK